MNVGACAMTGLRRFSWLFAAVVLLAGCQAAPPPRAEQTLPPDVAPEPLPLPDARVYRVVPGESEIRVLVFRTGPLAKFGHNHVIRTTAVTGTVYRGASVARSGFRITVPVRTLEVDPPAARAQEGEAFESELSDGAVRDTRDNMLGEQVLDAERHPEIEVRSITLTGPSWNPDVRMRITLRGKSRDLVAPVAVTECDGRLLVTTTFSLRQSDFGITPFTALNGGLSVADSIQVRARILTEPE